MIHSFLAGGPLYSARHRVMIKTFFLSLLMVTFSLATEPQVKPEDLPRIKPAQPADVLKTFQVRKGFHIELVAAEPLVIDPIAMCFDENGRLGRDQLDV